MTKYFEEIEDIRQQGKIKYLLVEVIVMTIIAGQQKVPITFMFHSFSFCPILLKKLLSFGMTLQKLKFPTKVWVHICIREVDICTFFYFILILLYFNIKIYFNQFFP